MKPQIVKQISERSIENCHKIKKVDDDSFHTSISSWWYYRLLENTESLRSLKPLLSLLRLETYQIRRGSEFPLGPSW
jgi:hypothetical protein